MSRICVVGSTNVDLTVRAPRLPRPGETVLGSSFCVGFGGKGSNQAVMAARLGADVAFLSKVGTDPFGPQALDNLRRQGVATDHVLTHHDLPTGTAFILVDGSAQNQIVVVPGANAALSPADVRAAAPLIRSSALLLCQLEVPLDSVHEALRIAREAGTRTLLNPAPATALPDDLLALVDLCVPNETELEALAGPGPSP